MSETKIRLPSGVRDFLPQAATRRVRIASRLMGRFESWGYQRIITPLFECADVLERGLGMDAKAAAIRFIEPATGEVVALRPDITPQVARIAATRMADIGGPLRLCYEGAVARMGSGARGQREVMQAGVEFIGASGPGADAELLALAAAAMETTEIAERSLDVGHVALARLALSDLGDDSLSETLTSCLRRKDRIGVARAARHLPEAQRALLEALPSLFGEPEAVLQRVRKLDIPKKVRQSLDDLEQTILWACEQNEASDLLRDLTLDLGELRGFEYYTGMRVHAFVKGAGGPVLRGGRYNQLVERYGRPAFATGFAVDIESLAQAESAQEEGSGVRLHPGCLVLVDEEHRRLAAAIARTLRDAGVRVAVEDASNWPSSRRTDLHTYADRVSLPSVVLLESEKFQFLRTDFPASPLWVNTGRGTAPPQNAQSMSDALLTVLSGRES
ncbi:MAG: ATP phosphoribosyltransferase regulatory subunit [Myxococcales bacterium]|nr:ATP phosphoribosyltransferase regulatory subunit [Myxococcales bacterium]